MASPAGMAGRGASPRRPGRAATRRIAAIDVGSNSIRQIVADVSRSGTIRIVDEMRAQPRLGAGLDATGALSADAMRRALEALGRMAQLAAQLGAKRVEAVQRAVSKYVPEGPLPQILLTDVDVDGGSGEYFDRIDNAYRQSIPAPRLDGGGGGSGSSSGSGSSGGGSSGGGSSGSN